jgi:hypothetical protein
MGCYMKNNKIIMAIVVAGLFTLPAMAKEQTSLINVEKVKRDAVKHDELSIEVALLKLELERAQLNQQIAESNSVVSSLSNESKLELKADEIRAGFEETQNEQEKVIKGLQKKIRQLNTNKIVEKQAELKLDPLEKIFVTSIRGIGNNLTAQFYVDNDLMHRRKGDMLSEGVFVENITGNGALIKTKTSSKFLPVTTVEQAHYKVKKVPIMNQKKFHNNNGNDQNDRRRN